MKFSKATAAIALLAATATLFAQTAASTKAPGGLAKDKIPQFVIIGSDDNTNPEAIKWMSELMSSGTNANGSTRYMSFYVNSRNSSETWEKIPELKTEVKAAYDAGHEIGNHTATHMRFVGTGAADENFSKREPWEAIYENMKEVSDAMKGIGIPKEHQYGFRTPFLSYSDSAYSAMQKLGFLYDCSINAGYEFSTPGKANFPYTLDIIEKAQEAGKNGNVPVDNEYGNNWWGDAWEKEDEFPDGNPIREHKGLWTIPCSRVEVAEEDHDAVEAKLPDWADYITESWAVGGLDYNLWTETVLDSGESVRALMNTLRKTLAGNRAPFNYGMHSQYYFEEKADYSNMTPDQKQGIMEEFVRQASELEDVFFVSGDMVIAWMENPCEASEFDPANYHRVAVIPASVEPEPSPVLAIAKNTRANQPSFAFAGIQNGKINLQLKTGNYSVELYNLKGRLVRKTEINAINGVNSVNMKTNKLSEGVFVLNVKQKGVSVLSSKIAIK